MIESSSADDVASADLSLLCSDEVRGLVDEGHEQGYLSGAHIETTLRDMDLTVEQLEELFLALTDLGIDIVESDASAEPTILRRAATWTRLRPNSISRSSRSAAIRCACTSWRWARCPC